MEKISNSTKLLIGGIVLTFISYFLPFFQYSFWGISIHYSLSQMPEANSMLYFPLLGLMAMITLCFLPAVYRHNTKTFVTYQLGIWLFNSICFVIFFIQNDLLEAFRELSANIGIGGILYFIGNVVILIGLYQTWSGTGVEFIPSVPNTAKRYPPIFPEVRAPSYSARNHEYYQGASGDAWIISKDGRNSRLYIGETTIGRSPDNDFKIEDAKVSKHHAKIIEQNGHFTLADLGSTNGTLLNGKVVHEPQFLYSNDVILFGDSYKVQFVILGNNNKKGERK